MSADGSRVRRPFRMLLERDVAEVERRLRLHRENAPKRIAAELGLHENTISRINLGRHPVQIRLGTAAGRPSLTVADCTVGFRTNRPRSGP
jgi:hypothetical protein